MKEAIRVNYEPAMEQYAVYIGTKLAGYALDIQAVGDIIRFMEDTNENTSKICDNESSGRATKPAAQKSQ